MGILKPNVDVFGSMAVRLGFCTQGQVDEVVLAQQELKQKGQLRMIGEMLLERRIVTPQQQRLICRALGIVTGPIPGCSIVRKIGQGGMGGVYLAKEEATGRHVAVKLISSLATEGGTYGRRLLAEAATAATVVHPNLVSPIRAGEEAGTFYLVMEFVDGPNTRELVDGAGRFSSAKARDAGRQVAAALTCIGRHGIIHGDIKPENVLLRADGVAKVCDFGVSRRLDAIDPNRKRFGGTPAFAAPEALLGEELDLRSDEYSLGATMYYWVTGRRAFEPPPSSRGSSTKFFLAQVHVDGPDPREVQPDVDERLAAVIHRMIRRDRRERFPSPEAVEQALAVSQL
jgi:serine/threonine-protein kinase